MYMLQWYGNNHNYRVTCLYGFARSLEASVSWISVHLVHVWGWVIALSPCKYVYMKFRRLTFHSHVPSLGETTPVPAQTGTHLQMYIFMFMQKTEQLTYCVLQVSCLEGVGNGQLAMSLYKLIASVWCTLI